MTQTSKSSKAKRGLSLLAGLGLALAASQPALAQTGKTYAFPGIPDNSVEKFGGPQGVHNWVESLFYYIMLDNRINWIFSEFGNVERQIMLNTQLEQMVLGGNVEYQGASMAAAHADLGITMGQFNAVVEAAYSACERVHTPYHTCNQLIAALAPFTFDIVTR
ncbi:MAG: group 1 truncated hemoglobin [Nevskiales bacterium]|nr:group 1 truncated hemoglobin [Nevskiales bacterium]MDD3761855.1 group 1 truncated hemoglobin [Nevskiales bacterium]